MEFYFPSDVDDKEYFLNVLHDCDMRVNELLEVRKSCIKGAGNGVFALTDIKRNRIIQQYRGTEYSKYVYIDGVKRKREYPKLLSTDALTYTYELVDGTTVMPNKDCIVRYINDIVDLEKTLLSKSKVLLKDKRYNVAFEEAYGTVFIYAIKDIYKGDELYIHYGCDYWKDCYTSRLNSIKRRKYIASGKMIQALITNSLRKHYHLREINSFRFF